MIDLYDGVARHGMALPAGSCPTVGVAGLTLGRGPGVLDAGVGADRATTSRRSRS